MAKGYLIGRRGIAALNRLINTTSLTPSDPSGAKIIESRRYPTPFAIRWSTEVDGWIIAPGDVTYGGAKIAIENLEALDNFWYKIPEIPQTIDGAKIHLNIDTKKSTATISKDSSADQSITLATVTRNDKGEVSVVQHVTSALHLGGGSGGGSGGGVTVHDDVIVAISMDYVDSQSDEDFSAHPYAIRLRRGRLKINGGALTVEEDDELKQFVDTTPIDERYG